MPGSKNAPGRGNMDQGPGVRVWRGHLRKSEGPVRVCVVSEGDMRVWGGKRWNHEQSLEEDFGFYSGIQEITGAPSHLRPHHVPTWQRNITMGHSFISCLLCLLPLMHILLCYNIYFSKAQNWSFSTEYIQLSKTKQNPWSNHCHGNQIYIIRISE